MGIKKTFPAQAAERTKELGYRVRLARTRRGMSIAEVAAKAGINRNTLNALELGKPGHVVRQWPIEGLPMQSTKAWQWQRARFSRG